MSQLNADLGGNDLSKNTFLASSGNGCGFMFTEIGNDTGMGSDGDGILYFSTNGNKHFLSEMALTYYYGPDQIVNLDGVRQTGFHCFRGAVPIQGGPPRMSEMRDCAMLVSGATHGFQMIFAFEGIYYRHLNWNGVPSQWWHISMTSG